MGYLPDYKRYLAVYFNGYGIFGTPIQASFMVRDCDSHKATSHDANKIKKSMHRVFKKCLAPFDVMQSIVACYQDHGL